MTKKALGKGLGAFIPEEFGILKEDRYEEIEIDKIRPNPNQPRTMFDEGAIDELAQSIKETGIIQPILVVPEDDYYKIIVGERRWRAAQKAGLRFVPAIVRNITTEKQLEISLIENIHREDLNPLEVAQAFHDLAEALGLTQQEIADKVGKDRASVANYMRLLKLP
ncbi:MAG: ParB/RepB/Spo0J family partition protein, partial [Candidatus Aminicenantes bacterium]|nr:ParB/RepB/Spo0J family partition protein [Candidatus Aminicenantes bacterium]